MKDRARLGTAGEMTPELGRPRLMLALDCRRSRTANGVTGTAALFVCSPRRGPRGQVCDATSHVGCLATSVVPPGVPSPSPALLRVPPPFPFLSIGVGVVARHPRRFALLECMLACFAPASLPPCRCERARVFSIHTATVVPKPRLPFALPEAKPKRKPRRRRCLAHHVGG